MSPGVALVAMAAFLRPSIARAQDLPRGAVQPPGSESWQHDVVTDGFESAQKEATPTRPEDTSTASVAFGAMLLGGNSRLIGASIDGRLRIRRDGDQFSGAVAGNYSRGGPARQPMVTTVENFQGRLRYDRFITEQWVGFVGAQVRRDRFQGLELRTQWDPGIAYYFSDESEERLWVEAGYELLYDIRRDDARVVLDETGEDMPDPTNQPLLLDKTRTLSSTRLLWGYASDVNDTVTFVANLEYIAALVRAQLFRINANASLSAKLRGRWSAAMKFSASYENEPLPEKVSLDTATSMNLVYSFP